MTSFASMQPPGAGHTYVRIGALVPLTPPGWVEAGRHLLAGLELAVNDVNDMGGIDGSPLQLVVRDTAADPDLAVAAVNEMAAQDVAAVAGEYHSVVAQAAARQAHRLGLPFLCSSAVIDELTDEATDWVARLAPAQSHGWRIYADALLAAGHRRIGVAITSSVYWERGTRILRERVDAAGGTVIAFDAHAVSDTALCAALVDNAVDVLLLLVGHPQPAQSIVGAVRGDPSLRSLALGAPAGQPEFAQWSTPWGNHGTAISFLRYAPEHFGPLGTRVEAELYDRLAQAPSFVAFEGYDTVLVLADMLRAQGVRHFRERPQWSRVSVIGTRGTIRFSRQPGISAWQWAWAPVRVVDRDPDQPDRLRTLHTDPRAGSDATTR